SQHERRNHPNVILRIVGDGSVGGAIKCAASGILGQPGEQATGPGSAVISRSREADRAGTAIVDATNLVSSHNRGAIREAIRFNTGLVISSSRGRTGSLGKWIGTDHKRTSRQSNHYW